MASLRKEKPTRTEQEMFPLIESWLKSKLTQKEFSQKHKLPLHILPYWIGRYRNAHPIEHAPPSNPASFIQLTPSTANVDPSPGLDPGPATLPIAKLVDPSPAPVIPDPCNSTDSANSVLVNGSGLSFRSQNTLLLPGSCHLPERTCIGMFSLTSQQRYFLYTEAVDMRKSFDGLSGIVQNQLGKNAASGDVYIFLGKDLTKVKLLVGSNQGLISYLVGGPSLAVSYKVLIPMSTCRIS
jgi:hypothetical protein